jgi:hypothetical protein
MPKIQNAKRVAIFQPAVDVTFEDCRLYLV